jgi:proton-translocating NADH-quinone oxidoreductase chain N
MVIPASLYFLFTPMLVVLTGLLAERVGSPKLRDIVAVVLSALGIVFTWTLYSALQAAPDNILVFSLGGGPPLGASFEIDMMGMFMAFSATILGFFATVYSYKYMEHDTRLTEYYTLLSALVVGMVGVAFAGDFFTMFIFWEMMGIASYALVSFRKDLWGPIEAGFKYMVMGSVGSTVLFFGIALVYGITGTLNFAQVSSVIHGQPMNLWYYLVFALFVIGFGVKTAIVPVHTWLPDAHPEAPSPISAMLSGILIETGLYAIARVLFLLFEPSVFKVTIALFAALTMTLGNMMALRQDDVKRMLAYSSIAQMGYMLVGVSTGLTYGLMGTLLHVLNHSLMKGLAFLSVGSIVHETGTRDIKKLQGVGKAMPFTTLAVVVSFLGLGGVPGTNGFVSKFILFNAALGADMLLLAVLGVLNSALSMAYYLRVIMVLLSGEVEEGMTAKEAPLLMVGVTLVMAILIVVLGLYPSPVVVIASKGAESLVDNLSMYIGVIMS